ncbi:translation initiation factor IF-3 [Mycoplasma sp. M5725]|uniref:Translation initiation factor IF-3 n=1 Tax=Mycoplasma phocimorsus TaxID=3045839 RepID=A0AAJ1PT11_9MOLU|nr:translation initiation factor IF-3 [Mycoplasma phocimorsus]MDJ1646001.1 translation initiation factor IF-3 [Mycoplasma phocimorsus]MDJ1646281.1 translation initiation factor IF-3 [Mycoplasma phocimorsus]MDJ1646885.1 translation initiation factor IF-3 [Mycoplasma phocimorsus]MDJ1647852.1 translation initiation factor IF-3 [Mycoplasma phocimorsus]MDJ1648447.1 translation initiation factor IF-3 [Mycoplasma phocimorsus]
MLNDDIPFKKVFLVGSENEKIGVMETSRAIEMAKESKMDLVLISSTPKPIAKILDYGKFKYDRKKKAKQAKEKQTTIQNRQVRLTPLIGQHDMETKARKVREFLLEGDRIKISLKFRGREMARQDLGHDTLSRFYKLVEDLSEISKEPTLTDRFLDMHIQPSKLKIAKWKKMQNEENNIDQNKESEQEDI